jgi:4-oxalocrotonate tautomerase
MPIVIIQAREIPTNKKRQLVEKITALVCETYGLPAASITVLIQEYPSENIGVAGCLLADRHT